MINRKLRIFVTRAVRYTKVLLLLFDIIVLNLSFFVAIYLRFGTFDFPYHSDYLRLLGLGNVVWVLLIGVFDAYKVMRFELVDMMLRRTFRMAVTHILLLLLVSYIIDFRDSSRFVLMIFFCFMLGGTLLYRVFLFEMLKYMRRRGVNHKVVAIVGYNDNAKDIYEVLTADVAYGYRVMGFFTDEDVNPREVRYIGPIDSIEDHLKKGLIEELYVALTTTNARRVHKIFGLCDRYGVRVLIIPDFQKYTTARRVQIHYYSHIPVLRMRTEPMAYFVNKLVKRAFDVVFSLFVILLVFPWLFPILMIGVKLSSSGPVFFKQRRSGEDKREFTCYKFRSMRVNELAHEKQANENDPRITRFGAFLRRTNLDELPQFFNVLTGSMSVVGPRPHMLRHTEQYSELIHNYLVRHYAKPGITGWAQVNGYHGETRQLRSMKKRVEYDIWYIENWSFMLDLRIILSTAFDTLRSCFKR